MEQMPLPVDVTGRTIPARHNHSGPIFSGSPVGKGGRHIASRPVPCTHSAQS